MRKGKQKTQECNKPCKYRDRVNEIVKAQAQEPDKEFLSWLRDRSEKALGYLCDRCPVREKANENRTN